MKEQPVNTNQFLRHSEESVREDELFFLRYFKMKDADPSKRKVKKEDEDEEKDIEDGILAGFFLRNFLVAGKFTNFRGLNVFTWEHSFTMKRPDLKFSG